MFASSAKPVDRAKVARKKARRAAVGLAVRLIAQRVQPVILATAGLTLISISAFVIHVALGFAVSGLACWGLEWRLNR